ncbi:hypothetical protein VB796_06665 [Arcicella sp. LKC2W]|uniref:hypothetical protein n=1 Tax=Arcicella sp. LKC2W TaxID=2984198 RepID=UPI002B220753|nr:hypothetical protein [Arcicella sp. LKC2W]MEA5458710.1 hypothetical protein [Arcicella sp. LKC2W]
MIYRLLVQKNNEWQELDLPKDFGSSLILNSGFLGLIQSGSFTFTSSLPTTQNNCVILQNVQYPQVVADRKIQLPAKLLVGSTEFYSWYFVLRRAGQKSYSYDLIQTPGNQPRNFYEKKLWELDFGKLDLVGIPAQTQIWTLNLYGTDNLSKYFINPVADTAVIGQPIPSPVWFELLINNTVVAEAPEFSNQNSYFYDYWYNEKDPETRFLLCTSKIKDYSVSMNLPKSGTGSINVVQIDSNKPITSVSIKIYNKTMYSVVGKGTLLSTHNLTRLEYNDVSQSLNAIVEYQNLYPFKFLTYYNDSYYPSDNTQYEGIVNQYKGDDFHLNDGLITIDLAPKNSLKLNNCLSNENLNTYPISPCFSLIFILEKICTMMGFTLDAEIFKDKIKAGDAYLGDLHLINNVDFAEQLAGTTIPANMYSTTMSYSKFMPDMTVKQFIDAVRTTFCLSVKYDYQANKITIVKAKEVLNSDKVINISDLIMRMPTAESNDKTYYQLRFKNADNTALSQQNYPTDTAIANDGRSYTPIEAGFTPVLNNMDLDEFMISDPNPYIPTVNETAKSPIYLEQKDNNPTPRLSFFLGFGSNGLSYIAKSDNKNDKIALSWSSTTTHKGLLEMFYLEYLEFLNNTTQWTSEIWLTELELANFDFTAKYYAYGTAFLAETLSPKFPIKDRTPIKLLSL